MVGGANEGVVTHSFCRSTRSSSSTCMDGVVDVCGGDILHPIETGSTLLPTGTTVLKSVGPWAIVDPVQTRPLSCGHLGYQIGSQGELSELE